MNVGLSELLPLIGRLDTAPGFDTPRERFRRFLQEQVTAVPVAETLVHDCQHLVGEQRHRVLQDLAALLGRFLGFDISFGTYEASRTAPKIDGRWRSRGRLDVVLEVRSDQTANLGAEALVHAVTTMGALPQADNCPRIGLIVLSRHYMARERLERLLAALPPAPAIRLVSIRSLLVLATHVAAGQVTHIEVARLLQASFDLDLVIDLLARRLGDEAPSAEAPVASAPPPMVIAAGAAPREPAFWVASNFESDLQGSEFVPNVIGQRHLLGLAPAAEDALGRPDDWVCFFLPNRGIVGHAQLAAMVDRGTPLIRNAELYSRVYRLANVVLYEEPVVQAMRADRPFSVPSDMLANGGPCLAPITRRDFVHFTRDWTVTAPQSDPTTTAR